MEEELLFLSLEIGFRPLVPLQKVDLGLTHTQHHQCMADIVFGSQRGEVIADLLLAWTTSGFSSRPYGSLSVCARHLVHLQSLDPSPRLRPLVIQSIESIGRQGFGEVGVENLVGLLGRLGVGIDEIHYKSSWAELLLAIIESREGRDRLSYSYWELLVELDPPHYTNCRDLTNYNPEIAMSLRDVQEWDRLACWICVVWMARPTHPDEELGDLEQESMLLFRHRPDTIRKLEDWMKRSGREIPATLRELCKQGRLEAGQRGVPL